MMKLYQFAATYALKRPVGLNIRLKRTLPESFEEFGILCATHNILELYLWLSLRYPKYFIEHDLCLEQKEYAMAMIQKCLTTGRIQQDYSHADGYMKEYLAMKKVDPSFLPPAEFGNIREKTARIVESLPQSPSVVFKQEGQIRT
jgi:Mitochondrial degradasome RNA helicase subunit C terminal